MNNPTNKIGKSNRISETGSAAPRIANVTAISADMIQMTARPILILSTIALLVFASFTGTQAAVVADVEVNLEGNGSATEEPLSAQVAIEIADTENINDHVFHLHVTNTSPQTSSTEAGAPVITRLAFDFGTDRVAFELLESSSLWDYTEKTKPFCGRKRALYPYGISAQKPAPVNGIQRGETVTFTLRFGGSEALTPAVFDGFVWAMKFQVVGADGEDSGCAFGDAEIANPPLPPVVYSWSEFVASAAEVWPGLPSDSKNPDTRAGSLEINTNGGFGFGGEFQDPAYEAGIVSLRNGNGPVVEQKQVNRRWPPALDSDGCNPSRSFPECWMWGNDRNIRDAQSGAMIALTGSLDAQSVLSAVVPERAGDSNDGFDSISPRVTVQGGLIGEYAYFTGADNSHQIIIATWEVPGERVLREETQMLLRGRYDWQCDGLGAPDVMVPLFYVNGADSNDNLITAAVTIEEDLPNRLTIRVDVQLALEIVRDAYAQNSIALEGACASP